MFKGIIVFLIPALCACNIIHGQDNHFRLSAGGAMNINNFSWSIAGNARGESPNVLSELKFINITSLGAFLNGMYRPIKTMEIHTSYQKYGAISGSVVDTDYNGDNRTDAVYNEHFSSNKGHIETFSAGAVISGLVRKKYKLKAGIHYLNTTQNYYLLSVDNAKLNTTYQAKWSGAGFSAGGEYKINKQLNANASFTYYFITYKAVANWNLRRDFLHPVSFRQNANGNVIEGQLSLSLRLNAIFNLIVDGKTGRSTSRKGVDIAYLANDTQIATRLNGAVRNYFEIRMGTAVSF